VRATCSAASLLLDGCPNEPAVAPSHDSWGAIGRAQVALNPDRRLPSVPPPSTVATQVIDMIAGIDDPRKAVDVLVAEANARWMREEQVREE
jgi:hypothetical protein